MDNNWINALEKYNWNIDLRHFKGAASNISYFNRIVGSDDVILFENTFRAAINDASSFEIAGEVCFWKNGTQFGNKITKNLLTHLKEGYNWCGFIKSIKDISIEPSYDNFEYLKLACNQLHGFATPITFLAFYNPIEFPMVDKHIANWWKGHKEAYGYKDAPDFLQRNDGWIKPNEHNWDAYIAWKAFCCDYAKKISDNYRLNWRARDVEMAVWEAQKNEILLEVLS